MGSIMLLRHDDGCTSYIDGSGCCRQCGFHPDMQSTAFADVDLNEARRILKEEGGTLMTCRRVPVVLEERAPE